MELKKLELKLKKIKLILKMKKIKSKKIFKFNYRIFKFKEEHYKQTRRETRRRIFFMERNKKIKRETIMRESERKEEKNRTKIKKNQGDI